MKKRKEKVLWKKMKPFNLDRVIRKNYFRGFILVLISFLVTLITITTYIVHYFLVFAMAEWIAPMLLQKCVN